MVSSHSKLFFPLILLVWVLAHGGTREASGDGLGDGEGKLVALNGAHGRLALATGWKGALVGTWCDVVDCNFHVYAISVKDMKAI